MRKLLGFLLLNCFAFHAIADDKADAKTVAAYLAKLPADKTTLKSNDKKLSADEKKVLEWLTANTSFAKNRKGEYSFVLEKSKAGDKASYALRRYKEQGLKPELKEGQEYIGVRFIPDGLACPEFHGVISLDGPKMLAFWSES